VTRPRAGLQGQPRGDPPLPSAPEASSTAAGPAVGDQLRQGPPLPAPTRLRPTAPGVLDEGRPFAAPYSPSDATRRPGGPGPITTADGSPSRAGPAVSSSKVTFLNVSVGRARREPETSDNLPACQPLSQTNFLDVRNSRSLSAPVAALVLDHGVPASRGGADSKDSTALQATAQPDVTGLDAEVGQGRRFLHRLFFFAAMIPLNDGLARLVDLLHQPLHHGGQRGLDDLVAPRR